MLLKKYVPQVEGSRVTQPSRDVGTSVCAKQKGKDSHQVLARGVGIIKQVIDGIEKKNSRNLEIRNFSHWG